MKCSSATVNNKNYNNCKTLPMYGNIVFDMINDVDEDCVAFSGIKSRAWEAIVNQHN